MLEDVAKTKRAMAEFNFELAMQVIRNKGSQIVKSITNIFKNKNIAGISGPKIIANFSKPSDPVLNSSMNSLYSETEYGSNEASNDSRLGRSR